MSFAERLKLIVEADVSPALRGFEKLSGMASNFAGKLSSAVATFQKFMNIASETGQMRQTQASFRGLGVDIERLQKAVDGTVSQMGLMAVANKAMRGEMGLTGTEMERVLRAADALNDQGFGETVEIADNLTRALKLGTTRSLREYNITADETKGKQGVVNELMQKFQDIAAEGGPEDAMNKRFEQFNVRLDDAVARLKMALGEMVMSFLAALDELFDMVDQAGRKGQRDRDADEVMRQMGRQGKGAKALESTWMPGVARLGSQFTTIGTGAIDDLTTEAGGMLDEAAIARDPILAQEFSARMRIVAARRAFEKSQSEVADILKGEARNKKRRDTGAGGGFKLDFEDVGEREIDLFQAQYLQGGGSQRDMPSSQRDLGGRMPSEQGGGGGRVAQGADLVADMAERQKAFDALMADMADRQQMAGAAYGALSDGIAASVNAAITGSESISQAFKRAAAAALKATAVQAAVSALWETAKGFASLAVGSPGAAAHFKAAAIFAATAVAAGSASALMGGGGGRAGAPAGAGAGGGGGFARGAGGGGGGNNITIIQVGDVFGDHRNAGEQIDKAIRAATRAGLTRDSNNVAVRFR